MALLIGAALGVVRGDLPGADPKSAGQPRHHRDQRRRVHGRARRHRRDRRRLLRRRRRRAGRWTVHRRPRLRAVLPQRPRGLPADRRRHRGRCGAELGEPVDRHQTRPSHRGHRGGLAAGHAQRLDVGAGAADDDRACLGVTAVAGARWAHSCRFCRWVTMPPVRSACGRTVPGSPTSSSASGWWPLACAAAGPVSFVALAAPQLARRLTAGPGVGLAVGGDGRGAAAGQRRDRPAGVPRQRAAGGCGDRVAGRRVPDPPARRAGTETLGADTIPGSAPNISRSATRTPPSSPICRVDVLDGRVTAIVGPNACGKSTLLRGLARLLKPSGGQVILDGQDIGGLHTKEVARRLGLLPQTSIAPEGITRGRPGVAGPVPPPESAAPVVPRRRSRRRRRDALYRGDRSVPADWSTNCPAVSVNGYGWRWCSPSRPR